MILDFTEVIHEPWGRKTREEAWQPAVDLYETDESYLIEVDLPGVLPNDIAVRVDDRSVTIAGTRRSTSWMQSAQGVSIERRHGSFSRTFQLSCRVDPERIEHRHEEGIHYVRIWKKKPQEADG